MTKEQHAIISVVAGATALPIIFFVPSIGGILCLAGIGFGISGVRTARQQIAIAGIALCVAVLLIGRIYSFFFCPTVGGLGGG